jgi:uncharacterized cupin superfamily protein
MAVDDIMVILAGRLTVSSEDGTVTARPGDIVHMPKSETVTIRSREQGAMTACVSCPQWRRHDHRLSQPVLPSSVLGARLAAASGACARDSAARKRSISGESPNRL